MVDSLDLWNLQLADVYDDEETLLSPFDEPPPSLGVVACQLASGVDRVAASTSPYCSLERMTGIPIPSVANKIQNKHYKNIYRRTCNGDFCARWNAYGPLSLTIVVAIVDTDHRNLHTHIILTLLVCIVNDSYLCVASERGDNAFYFVPVCLETINNSYT